MILVAGIAASVLIQTMESLQNTAMKIGTETVRDVSNGVKITHVSGYNNGSKITQMAIFVATTAGSEEVDLSHVHIHLSDSSKSVVLNYDMNCYSSSVSNGIFSTINSSNLSSTTFGLMKIRDVDNSCTSNTPVINRDDLVVLIVNTTKCFSGIGTRTDVSGMIIPEHGITGVFAFTTPSYYVDAIVDLY